MVKGTGSGDREAGFQSWLPLYQLREFSLSVPQLLHV